MTLAGRSGAAMSSDEVTALADVVSILLDDIHKQKGTPINVELSEGVTLTGADDSGTLDAPAESASVAHD